MAMVMATVGSRVWKALLVVKCEGQEIETVASFRYLGWIYTADGSTEEAIEDRLG